MKRFFPLAAAFLAVSFLRVSDAAAGNGVVAGRVLDDATGAPVVAADVFLIGTPHGMVTTPEGTYSFPAPAGAYDLRVFHVAFKPSVLEDVVVPSGDTLFLEVRLGSSDHEMKAIEVKGDAVESAEFALLSRRKKSAAVSDGISAEQIGKASSSDAGDALKRVTGVTVSEDKFVQVRGLGGRYSNTVFNGSKLPSPEPNKSVVPMDLFPAGLLEKVSVAKTFTPDLSGDFAGGSVQIVTKELPGTMNLSFSSSVGWHSHTTFRNGLGYKGGSLDFLGFDDGTRAVPSLIEALASEQAIRESGPYSDYGFDDEQIREFGRSFDNVWSPRSEKAALDQSYSFSLGNKTGLFGRQLGYLLSFNYGNSHKYSEEERNTYRASDAGGGVALTPFTRYDVKSGTNSVLWGQVLNATLKLSSVDKISLKTMYTRSADDEARIYEGYNADRGTDLRNYRLRYVERGLLSLQLGGDHEVRRLRGSMLTWQSSFSRVTRSEPDNREVLYEKRNDDWVFFDITQSGSRFFFDLDENEAGGKLDWSMPLDGRPSSENRLKMGVLWSDKDRDFSGRRFRFEQSDNIQESVDLTGTPEEILAEENIEPGLFELRETTRAVDNYRASHDVAAAYLLMDLPVAARTRAVAGLRVENSSQRLTSFDPFSTTEAPIVTDLETTDYLPSLNLKYELNPESSLRAAYSRTVARPDFRELAPFEFTDFIGGRAEIGNPELNRTLIENYDLRWERFGSGGSLLALSVFYKNFDDPIEQIIQPSATLRASYENAEGASTYGVEMEWRRSLRFLSPGLRDWSINANLTLMDTEVRLREDGYSVQTSNNRPLQGQSPFVLNTTLSYEAPSRGTAVNVLFHIFGKRISEVGAQGLPDVYEKARPQLDLNWKQRLSGGMSLKVAAKNLLDPDHDYTQGDEIYRRTSAGRSVSLGFGYDL